MTPKKILSKRGISLITVFIFPLHNRCEKVKISLCLRMKEYSREEALLILALHTKQWRTSCSSVLTLGRQPQFTPDKRLGGPHCQS